MDIKKLWDSVLVEMELSVSKPSFATWFKDTGISHQDDGVIFVNVPNNFVKDWLLKKYHSNILRALRDQSPQIRSVEYIISRDEVRKKPTQESAENDSGSASSSMDMGGVGNSASGELPLSDYYINKEDRLNPKYTFDSFVVGPFNELAHAAAQAIIKKPGIVYNPVFVYGSTGHGKTHLIQAIGNQIKKLYPETRVHYVTSERFATDYINSVHSGQGYGSAGANKVNNFKEKYRKYDVLIMDDIQFLSKTEKTQEELFHLFNYLHDNNKQIIFSSDKHPNYIPNLEERLRSRFHAGMIVDIPAPDHESRVAILKNKLASQNVSVAADIIDFLAASISTNIRELEGALNAIVMQTQMKGHEPSLQEVRNLIKNTNKPMKKLLSPKEVVKIVADFYNIEEDSIYEKTRKKEVIKPRQIAMYILREDFNISYPSIGEKVGGRDHTTVIHSCEKIKHDLKGSASLGQEISQIRSMIS